MIFVFFRFIKFHNRTEFYYLVSNQHCQTVVSYSEFFRTLRISHGFVVNQNASFDKMISSKTAALSVIKIRKASQSDSKWILHHRVEMFKDMGESEESLRETAKLTKQYLEDGWTKDYVYFLVEDDSKVIGGCGISTFRVPPKSSLRNGIFAYLSNMFIEPEWRRKGVGKLLVNYVIDFCKEKQIGLLFLHASDNGLLLYNSLGFGSSEKLMQRMIMTDSEI